MIPSPWFAPPPSLASECADLFAPSWAPPFRCRSVMVNAGVCGRFTGGAWRAVALAAAAVPPPLGAAASPSWCGAAVFPVRLGPLFGLGGGRPGGSGPGGPAVGWGGALFPRPPLPSDSRTLVQALAWLPCSPRRRRAALAGSGRP